MIRLVCLVGDPRASPIALGGVCKIGAEGLASLVVQNTGFSMLSSGLGEGRTTGFAAFQAGAHLRLAVARPPSVLGANK